VANCHLMDPRDLPEAGWKSSVQAPAGGRIDFKFLPDNSMMAGTEMMGISMKIAVYGERGWLTSTRNWTEKFLQPDGWTGRGKLPVWVTSICLITITLAMIFLVLFRQWQENQRLKGIAANNAISDLQTQVNRLRQENSEIEAQIAGLRQLQIQAL